MRLHILSDLHLESGPYRIPEGLPHDIVVAAGDIDTGLRGLEFLKSVSRPVVYVLGNHEFYSPAGEVDREDRLDQIRQAAAGSNVQVLERDALVIGGVRFLGTTLWTSYGNGYPGLLREALATQNDYLSIGAQRWFADADNVEWFRKQGRGIWTEEQLAAAIDRRRFHPLSGLALHRSSIAWLQEQLAQPFDGETVVVTHHHPSFESLRRYGVDERVLTDKSTWDRRGLTDDNDRFRVASYASDLDHLLRRHRHRIALWVCALCGAPHKAALSRVRFYPEFDA